jgi:hypothetical protein
MASKPPKMFTVDAPLHLHLPPSTPISCSIPPPHPPVQHRCYVFRPSTTCLLVMPSATCNQPLLPRSSPHTHPPVHRACRPGIQCCICWPIPAPAGVAHTTDQATQGGGVQVEGRGGRRQRQGSQGTWSGMGQWWKGRWDQQKQESGRLPRCALRVYTHVCKGGLTC